MTYIAGKTLEDVKSDYNGLLTRLLNSTPAETVLISHFGNFDQVKTDHLLKLAESAILEQGDKRHVMKRICSVLIEALQNMSLHGAHDSSGHMYAYCVLTRGTDYYRLLTGNAILTEDIESLEERMNELVRLDKNALRKQFIETLCNDDFTNKGGAGLGLLTIAKRSLDKVEFSIRPLNKDFGYFQIETALGIEA